MFEEKTVPDHVIAIHFSGKMTGEDIQQYKKILEGKLEKHGQLSFLIDFTGLSDMNANAFVEGTKADLEFLGHIDRFSRCAFVSDKEWPQALIDFIGPVLPTLEMKVFTPEQSDEAMNWVSELPEAPTADSPAFRFIPTSRDDVFAFEINGMISAEEMPGVIKEFEGFLERHDKVRLLNRMRHFGGIDPAVFMQGGLVSMKLAAMQKVERYAIVGAPGWMRKIIKSINPAFTDMDMRTFSKDKEQDAWEWLEAAPAGESAR
ncbi:hypothetical protein NOC27_175 [Nitrosococcus oceani AFC27]|nr:STAS/SEC14 domain-containing protein [Nitrosococcus oceani]EDZ66848.1 hypothetical protein NOC27_175 [Nitrosococcus oceani AFC27]